MQVYSCFTDMVEDASGANQPMPEGSINVRFRKLQQHEDRALATCNILVMEYCDRATLRHAMKKGVFHKRIDNTSVAVDLCAIVQVRGGGVGGEEGRREQRELDPGGEGPAESAPCWLAAPFPFPSLVPRRSSSRWLRPSSTCTA